VITSHKIQFIKESLPVLWGKTSKLALVVVINIKLWKI